MVFIYLPFYFGIGVIAFFVWRWAVLSWKIYGRRGLRPPGQAMRPASSRSLWSPPLLSAS
jgi:hypothetical protein